ncbi:MAG: PAS domain-containing protein [Planctomycetota bacterium]|nr:PAS domain-containing protein [Planctomycetota bacterium]
MANSTTLRQPIEELASLRKQVTQLEARHGRLAARVAAQMSLAFKDAPVGLCSFDCELRYVRINNFLAAINGIPIEQHIGKTVMEVLPEIAAAGVAKELRQVCELGDLVIRGTVTAETPAHAGEEHTYTHEYYALRSDEGEITGVACCVVDITDLGREQQARDDQSREIVGGSKLAIGRELRTTDLECEVNELCEQLGIEPRYDVPFDENGDSTPPNKPE